MDQFKRTIARYKRVFEYSLPDNFVNGQAGEWEVVLGADAERLGGEAGGAGPDLPGTGAHCACIKLRSLFWTQDWLTSYFRWAPRMGRYVSFWKRSRKVGFQIDRAKAWDMMAGQASRSMSSWLRSSSPWRWRYPHIEASWRTRRRGLKGAGQLNHVGNNILTLARTKFGQYFDIILTVFW